jgi:hypothetical protein
MVSWRSDHDNGNHSTLHASQTSRGHVGELPLAACQPPNAALLRSRFQKKIRLDVPSALPSQMIHRRGTEGEERASEASGGVMIVTGLNRTSCEFYLSCFPLSSLWLCGGSSGFAHYPGYSMAAVSWLLFRDTLRCVSCAIRRR